MFWIALQANMETHLPTLAFQSEAAIQPTLSSITSSTFVSRQSNALKATTRIQSKIYVSFLPIVTRSPYLHTIFIISLKQV